MKTFHLMFLIFVLTNSAVFAQTEQNQIQDKTSSAIKIEEFSNEPSGYVKMLTDNFFIKLQNEPTSQGYIISYGPNKPIARRETFLRNYILMRGFDAERITFITGGFNKEIKTEFWITPAGAESPKLIPTVEFFTEIGAATNQKIKNIIKEFDNALTKEQTATGYIINYGNALDIAKRERQIRNSINFRRYDAVRIVIINGGKSNTLKTIIWIVPEGAEPPTP
jgi:hypothetical protein